MTRKLSEKDAAAYIAAASVTVDLPIDPAYLPGVVQFVTLASEMAAVLDTVDLPDDDAPLAPVYRLPDGE